MLAVLEQPVLDVGLMFRKVRYAVLDSTGRQQEPFVYGSLSSKGAYLAAGRYELFDPGKRYVVRGLEARWTTALERVEEIEQHLVGLDTERASHSRIDRTALMDQAQDLPAVWNTPTTNTATKQRLIRMLIQELVLDLDDKANEAAVTIHWVSGRHAETRVLRVSTGRYLSDRKPNPVRPRDGIEQLLLVRRQAGTDLL